MDYHIIINWYIWEKNGVFNEIFINLVCIFLLIVMLFLISMKFNFINLYNYIYKYNIFLIKKWYGWKMSREGLKDGWKMEWVYWRDAETWKMKRRYSRCSRDNIQMWDESPKNLTWVHTQQGGLFLSKDQNKSASTLMSNRDRWGLGRDHLSGRMKKKMYVCNCAFQHSWLRLHQLGWIEN